MNKLYVFIAFAIGAAAGSAVTYKLIKDKYEKRYQEEREELREALLKNTPRDSEPKVEEPEEDEIDKMLRETKEERSLNLQKHAEIAQEQGYTNYTRPGEIDDDEPDADDSNDYKPYIINSIDFGQKDGFETISAMYFADQILVDDDYDIVDDVESFVGFESLGHFGDDEDDPDSVYVRNPRLRLDIEILRSELTYAEAMKNKPYKAEV